MMTGNFIDKKIRVFISSKCGEKNQSYNIVRRALKTLLEETGVISVYLFEDEPASSKVVGHDYIDELDDSDICLFLIDNYENISEGLLREINRAQHTNKKSIYLFLNDSTKEPTQIEKELKGVNGKHYYVEYVKDDFRDFINIGYKSILNEILKIYKDYCKDRLIRLDDEQVQNIELGRKTFSNLDIMISKQLFTGFDLTKNKLNNLLYNWHDEVKNTSDLDKYCLNILEMLLGEKCIRDVNVALLLDELDKIQSIDLHTLVSTRWKAIQQYYLGKVDSAIGILKEICIQEEVDNKLPTWLFNDILIDLRNMEIKQNNANNIMSSSLYAQTLIDKNDSIVYYPAVDRFSENFYEELFDSRIKTLTQSPYSVSLGNNLSVLYNSIINCFVTAIYYGSWTHLTMSVRKIKQAIFDYNTKEPDVKTSLTLLKLSILDGNIDDLKNIFSKYGYILSNCTFNEVLDLYNATNAQSIEYKKIICKLAVFKEVGYYFSDNDFVEISEEILKLSNEWVESPAPIVLVGKYITDAFKYNNLRMSQNKICKFCTLIFKHKYYRYYDDIFDLLYYLSLQEVDVDIIRQLVKEILAILNDEKSKQACYKIDRALLSIRKKRMDFTDEIDEMVKKYLSEFYSTTYALEVFSDTKAESENHIYRYIDTINERNRTQGKNGIISGYMDAPYKTIENIIDFNKLSLKKTILSKILSAIDGTLFSPTQTISAKVSAIQLLLFLKERKYRFTFDWNGYFQKYENTLNLLKKAVSFDFFTSDSELILEFNMLILRVALSKASPEEVLQLLSTYNSADDVTHIKSLEAVSVLIRNCFNVFSDDSILMLLLQYTVSCCYDDCFEVRNSAITTLFSFCITRQSSIAVNQLSKMMGDHDYRNKVTILNQIDIIKKVDLPTYNYIQSKARIDNNYLVRRKVQE